MSKKTSKTTPKTISKETPKGMSKKKKIIITVVVALVALLAIGFAILYNNGLSGLHNHTKPSEGQIRVACIGDSVTYGHGIKGWAKNNYPAVLQELLGDKYHVANFGESGRTLSPGGDKPYAESKQYELALEYGADIIVLMLGSNDTKPENWNGATQFISEYDDLIDVLRENNPDVRIIICTPPKAFFPEGQTAGKTNFDIQPLEVTVIRNAIRTYGLTKGLEVLDVYDLTQNHPEWFEADNVHPSNDGAYAIAELVAKKIK